MLDQKLIDRIECFLKENLKESRLKHTYAVAEQAVELADIYGADRDKARLASLFHDMYRNLTGQALDMFIRQLGVPDRYRGNSNLAHSKIAAEVMKKSYGITDTDILNAVSYHTTGRAGMSLLEKIVFIADAIEPGRNYGGVDEIREAAYEDIDKAVLMSLEGTIKYLSAKSAFIDSDTLEAYEYMRSIED
ncbi:MAG: bis(5'-nucleosyl)-tetraphosphatase (symmetrical) YqeK [Clostridiales bacterium]|nr:bis(5'-nucleosyl)-tetraphosphatase (symmetrical) YqeK [Clostridiales bacterium]